MADNWMVSSSLLSELELGEEMLKSYHLNIRDRFPEGGPAWQRILILDLPTGAFSPGADGKGIVIKEVFVSELAAVVEHMKS